MSLLKKTFIVKSYRNKNSFEGIQVLFKEYRIFGIKVWSIEIDRENVPSFAYIQHATLGSTDWKSKFAEFIK